MRRPKQPKPEENEELHRDFRDSPPIVMPKRRDIDEMVTELKARQKKARTFAESTYCQGAIDALEAFMLGKEMPAGIGEGVKRDHEHEPSFIDGSI